MTVPASFRGHQAILGLRDLVDALFPDTTEVLDGPNPGKELGVEFVAVGWDPDGAYHVVARRLDEDQNLCGRSTEVGEIACYLGVRRGDGDMEQARGRAVEMLETIEAAVRADKDGLGGAVDFASIGPEIGLRQMRSTKDAAVVDLMFAVSYEAYI